jgi:hypothetical protein
VAATYGIGNHIWLLSTVDKAQANKWDWIGRLVCIVASVFGKNVVIALLLGIQGSTHRQKSLFLHFIWVTNTILAILIITLLCPRCKPMAYVWDKSLDGTCDHVPSDVTEDVGLFQGSWMAASDIALAIYPAFIFWELKLPWKRKAALCALMGGGLIAGVCGAVKTAEVQLAYGTNDTTNSLSRLWWNAG